MYKRTNTIVSSKEKTRLAGKDVDEEFGGRNIPDSEELIKILLESQRKCYSRKSKNRDTNKGCIFERCSNGLNSGSNNISFDRALSFIRECRETISAKLDSEINTFFMESFRNSIQNFDEVFRPIGEDSMDEEEKETIELVEAEEAVRAIICGDCITTKNNTEAKDENENSGSSYSVNSSSTIIENNNRRSKRQKHKTPKKFKHKFFIRPECLAFKAVEVCKSCWRFLYGFSRHKINSASKRLKETNKIRPNPNNVELYDDKTYHDFSAEKTMDAFLKVDSKVGFKEGMSYKNK